MKTTFREEGKDLIMAFEGRLDTAAAPQTEKDMEVLTDCMGHDIVLDCTKMEYISSSGLRIFLGILKNAKLVSSRRDGKSIIYSLADEHVRTIIGQGREHIEE